MVVSTDCRGVESHAARGEEVHRQSDGSPSYPASPDSTMSPQHPHNGLVPAQSQLSEEAAEWFLCMLSPEADADDRYGNTVARNAAFREWYSRSPEHLRAFLDMCEVDHLLLKIDAEHHAEIDAIVATRKADVIPLYISRLARRRGKMRKAWIATAAAS